MARFKGSRSISYVSGRIGIGTSSPIYRLHVDEIVTDASSTVAAGRFRAYPTFTQSGSLIGAGLYTSIYPSTASGTLRTSDLSAVIADAALTSTNPNSGAFSSLVGLNTTVGIFAGAVGTVSRTIGVRVNQSFITGFVENAYGVKIERPSFGGTVVNEWGLWQDSSTAKNYFAGQLGLGLLPTARLHLASGTSSVAALKLTSGTLLTAPASGAVEYDGYNLYFTDSTNTRRMLAAIDSSGVQTSTNTITNTGNISLAPTGSVVVSSTTASTNSSTGSLIVKGGLGLSGSLYASGSIVTTGNIQGSSITATDGILTNVIQGNANLLLNPNGGNVGIGTSSPTAALDISNGATALIVGADDSAKTRTNSTVKYARVGMPHYLNAEEPLGLMFAVTGNSFNDVIFGGGSSTFNAATSLKFYTASNSTTQTGSERMRIDASGKVGIGTASPSQLLHIQGSGARMKIESVSSTDPVLEMSGLSYTNYLFANQTDGRWYLRTDSNSRHVWLQSSGSQGATAQGNVQIGGVQGGISAPTSQLVVRGNTSSSTTGVLDIQSYAGTSNFFVRNDGNVGIGTTTPIDLLHLGKMNATTSMILTDLGSSNTLRFAAFAGSGARIEQKNLGPTRIDFDPNPLDNTSWAEIGFFRGTSTTGFRQLAVYKGDGTATIDTSFRPGSNSFINANGGFTGVGTSSPVSVLDVNGLMASRSQQDMGGVGFLNSSGVGRWIIRNTAAESGVNSGSDLVFVARDDAGSYLSSPFFIKRSTGAATFNSNVNFNSHAILSSGSSLGIGTVSPTTKFELSDYNITSVNWSMLLRNSAVPDASGWGIGIKLKNSSDSGYEVNKWIGLAAVAGTNYSNRTDFVVYGTNGVASAPQERFRITGGGDVGIGTSAPNYTLDVSGTLRVTGTAYTNGGYSAWTAASDVRLKDIHGNYDRGLKDILNLDIVRFQYKKNSLGLDNSKEFIGVTAQNLQAAIPEAVSQESRGPLKGYLTINTTPVLWTVINGVKQLFKYVINLEDKVRQIELMLKSKVERDEFALLKKELAELKDENYKLKAYLCEKDAAASICKGQK